MALKVKMLADSQSSKPTENINRSLPMSFQTIMTLCLARAKTNQISFRLTIAICPIEVPVTRLVCGEEYPFLRSEIIG